MDMKVCFRASAAVSISLKAQNETAAAATTTTTKSMLITVDEAKILLGVVFKVGLPRNVQASKLLRVGEEFFQT